MFRRRRAEPVDPLGAVQPAVLHDRWRRPVEHIVAARRRFETLVESLRSGPVKERLSSVSEQIDRSVIAVWTSAQRAQDLQTALAQMDDVAVREELKSARRQLTRLEDADAAGPELQAARDDVAFAEQQFASINRMAGRLDEIAATLSRAQRDVDMSITLATEVALSTTGADPTASLSRAVDELSALQAALADLDQL
jgi:hypothetical protein